MLPLLIVDLVTKAPSYKPVDPLSIWVPLVGAILVGIISLLGNLLIARRSGTSLERTITADREAQILERRLPLYADILVFVTKRRQHREVGMAMIVINGVEALDPFDPKEIFDLLGRAHGLADGTVLTAFDAADQADMAAWRSWNFMKMIRGNPGDDRIGNEIVKRTEQMFREKGEANEADAALELAIRRSLHRDEAPPIQRPEFKEKPAGAESPEVEAPTS